MVRHGHWSASEGLSILQALRSLLRFLANTANDAENDTDTDDSSDDDTGYTAVGNLPAAGCGGIGSAGTAAEVVSRGTSSAATRTAGCAVRTAGKTPRVAQIITSRARCTSSGRCTRTALVGTLRAADSRGAVVTHRTWSGCRLEFSLSELRAENSVAHCRDENEKQT